MASPQLAQTFPDFEIDVLSVKRAKSEGPLFVVVWRADCPTCKLTMPFVDRLASRYKAATVVGISQNDDAETKEFVEENKLAMTNYSDPHLRVSSFLNVDTVPAYWLVGRDGKVSHLGVGWDSANLEAIAQALASQSSVAYSPLILPADNVPLHKPG